MTSGMGTIKITAIAVAISAALAGTAGWTAQGWRMGSKIDRLKTEYAEVTARANEEALAKYAELERQKQEAVNRAYRQSQINKSAADAARERVGRVRQHIATTERLQTASSAATIEYADTLGTVFGECIQTTGELAEKADGHALDARTLREAWPK
jgi:hypothetical protein